MRIAIFGTGALGGFLGGRLAQAGCDVTFIARKSVLSALQNKGLHIDSVEGEIFLPNVSTSDNPADVGEVDVVLLTIKTWQVPETVRLLKPLIGKDTLIVPFQNGVDSPGHLAKILGPDNICGGLARIICEMPEPAHIRHLNPSPYIAFGKLDDQVTERMKDLQGAFETAKITAEIPPDIQAALWSKFLLVASWGGVGAITRAPIGVIRAHKETRRMLRDCMLEIKSVAAARNIHLDGDIVANTLGIIDKFPQTGTTSMQRDIAENRLSELEAWNGAVVRLGRETGVSTPLNRVIYYSLLPLERRARGEIEFPI